MDRNLIESKAMNVWRSVRTRGAAHKAAGQLQRRYLSIHEYQSQGLLRDVSPRKLHPAGDQANSKLRREYLYPKAILLGVPEKQASMRQAWASFLTRIVREHS